MAKNVTGQVLGGQAKANLEGETVRDIYTALGLSGSYTPSINGEPAEMDETIDDYVFVSFAPAVKGGR
jgi:hypothetical protein